MKFIVASIFGLVVLSAPAQERPNIAGKGLPLRETQELIDASRASSPEFHARALLVLSESNSIVPAQKIKLTREAFEVPRSVKEPIKKAFGDGFISNDRSDVGWTTFAFALNLDRLSLQSKAVADVGVVNPSAFIGW